MKIMKDIRINDYYKVEDFVVLDEKVFHHYNEDETTFFAVKLQIGDVLTYKMGSHGVEVEKSPIIRWVSRNEYNRLIKNSGVIIF